MNRFQGIDSASLCSLAGRYNNPIPTRILAPMDCYKIPALGGVEKDDIWVCTPPQQCKKSAGHSYTSTIILFPWGGLGLSTFRQISFGCVSDNNTNS
jgi:hypothetical protein